MFSRDVFKFPGYFTVAGVDVSSFMALLIMLRRFRCPISGLDVAREFRILRPLSSGVAMASIRHIFSQIHGKIRYNLLCMQHTAVGTAVGLLLVSVFGIGLN